MNGVLISEPIRALDCVVEVPVPLVLVHVAQRRVNAALRRDCVATSGEQLGHTRSLESLVR